MANSYIPAASENASLKKGSKAKPAPLSDAFTKITAVKAGTAQPIRQHKR